MFTAKITGYNGRDARLNCDLAVKMGLSPSLARERLRLPRVVNGVRFDFKRIVQVGIVAAPPDPHTASEVRGDKEWSPAFVLADMDSLVPASSMQRRFVAAQNHMPQRDRRNGTDPEISPVQDRRDPAAVNFQDSVNNPRPSAADEGQCCKRQPDRGSRRNPHIDQWF